VQLINNRTFFFSLNVFLIYAVLSIIWSVNPSFGALKLVHLLIGNIPLIISLYIILNSDGIKVELIKSIILLGITAGIISLIINPFDPTLPYSFEVTRWSHISFGRFTGLAILLTVLILLDEEYFKKSIIYFIFTLFLLVTLLMSEHRSGIVSVVISLAFFSVSSFVVQSDYKKGIKTLVLILIIASVAYLLSIFNSTTGRFESLRELILKGKTDDGTINTRLEAYKTGFKMFAENPIFGHGLGGFNNKFMDSDIGNILKYPHNIIIEFLSELGFIGFGFLMMFIWAVIRRLILEKRELLVVFIHGIVLAMFSKDLSSNVLVWVFVSLLLNEKK
jgi:O-antigen ligase